MSLHVFGIRHHGPGCARSLRQALHELQPDILLVEGPPEGSTQLSWLGHEDLKPPVALLVYPPDAPQRAAFYPFAVFSPEWQALQYAHQQGLPARFIDLPRAQALVLDGGAAEAERSSGDDAPPQLEAPALPNGPAQPNGPRQSAGAPSSAAAVPAHAPTLPDWSEEVADDPLGALALAAGYSDRELWWEHQVEQRLDPSGLFQGIMEAMAALREECRATRRAAGSTPATGPAYGNGRTLEALREASMRQGIRAAQQEGYQRIAVVCGAWHAPALRDPGPARDDALLLKGLPRVKVEVAWVPWSYTRLCLRSGYGAGVASPGWYEHLWEARERAGLRWAARAARLLRQRDLDASAASVIEAVRLAEALAALRGLPMPGLAELNEAILSALCAASPARLRLIQQQLEVGHRLGRVPADAPAVPLQRDLEAQQRRLRLRPTTEQKVLDLDLRNETDRARSQLLHRLLLLQIAWGQPEEVGGKAGTFHEYWRLEWQVEFSVSLIEASVWGQTVAEAAANRGRDLADKAQDLSALTELLDRAMLAGLPELVTHVIGRLQAHAAVSADVRQLMDSLPALARVIRYGDVRGTSGQQVLPIFGGLFERVLVGLPGACSGLADQAAAEMAASIGHVQESLDLLDRPEQKPAWQELLRRLLADEGIHGLLRGWCCRLLLEQRAIDAESLHRQARLALSAAVPPRVAAAWVEGLLRGSGLVVLHHDPLWQALDTWLQDLSHEVFVELLPLVRRAFAGFHPPECRAMAEKVRRLGAAANAQARLPPQPGQEAPLNIERAGLVLPVLARVLGVAAHKGHMGENAS
jgi:hypothetical protein